MIKKYSNTGRFSELAILKRISHALIFLTFPAAIIAPTTSIAASCCGGSSGGSILLPKNNQQMFDVTTSIESYDGYWTQERQYKKDPEGSDLNQYSINFAYAQRLNDNWQMSTLIPYVQNQNTYSGDSSRVQGLGDSSVSLWYEAFDDVTCVYKFRGWQSLKPSIYIGSTLTIPTGISQYSDRVEKSFDVTGRGFYRLDTHLTIEKTIYPWSATYSWSYGQHFSRPVNQEYGNDVEPYTKRLGDRHSYSFTLAYTLFFRDLSMLTFTGSYTDLSEGQSTIDNENDHASDFQKITSGVNVSYSTPLRHWIVKAGMVQSDRGKGYPNTTLFSTGVSRVF